MKQLTREWLNSALDDLAAIERLKTEQGLSNIVAFHAQQAIEKSLKAIFEEKGIDFVKTHNLQSLYLKIENLLPFQVDELIISELDRLYIDSRYPTELGLMPHGKPGIKEAEAYYLEALRIESQIEAYLNAPDSSVK